MSDRGPDPRTRAALPLVLAVPAAAAAVLFALPLVGLALRAPWGTLVEHAAEPGVRSALALSLRASLGAAALAALLGLPLAAWLSQGRSGLRTTVRVLVTLPMILPPVVGGVALLLAFGRSGVVGGPLGRWFGVTLPFTEAAVVLAATYVAMPFFVLTVEGALRGLDGRHGEAARSLGAGPLRVFARVTLPMVAPAVGAGLLVAWARALGEFGATITFAGNLAGSTRTLPLAVHAALEDSPDAAIGLSLVMVAVSCAVLFLLRRRWFPLR